MRRIRLALVLVSVLAPVSGCAPTPVSYSVHDSTGETFELSCADSCDVTSGPPVDPALCEGAGWGWMAGRYFSLCEFCGPGTTSGRCRPLACTSDGECPSVGVDTYECDGGLCQHADQDRSPRDVLTPEAARFLCYADLPRPDSRSIYQEATLVREMALGTECPLSAASCTLPAVCTAP